MNARTGEHVDGVVVDGDPGLKATGDRRTLASVRREGEVALMKLRAALAGCVIAMALACEHAHASPAGYAVALDGIHGYLGRDLPDGLRPGNAITLSAWILRASPNGDLISPEPRGHAAVGLGFHFGISAGKVFCVKGNGSGAYVALVGTTSMPAGSWHHIAATTDGATMRVYLDGVLDGSLDDGSIIQWGDLPPVFPPSQTNWPSPAQLFIGADKSNSLGDGATIPDFDFFNGFVDEAQIWNRALSQSEINLYRSVSLTGTEPGLIAYWKFDEGTGTIAADASLHGADLTLFPGASWVVSTAPVSVDRAGEAPRPARVAAFPNPTSGATTILFDAPTRDALHVAVFDVSGRRIVDLGTATSGSEGPVLLRWDGRDRNGHAVPNGVYLVVCDSRGASMATRLLMLH